MAIIALMLNLKWYLVPSSCRRFTCLRCATVAAAKEESPETPGPVNESFDGVDRSFDRSTPINTSLSSWEMFWRGSVWVSNRILPTGPGAVTEGSDDKDPEAEAEKAAWMAPELLKKGKKAKKTPASDVYALGMTLWQLLHLAFHRAHARTRNGSCLWGGPA